MAFLKYARASVVHPNVGRVEWSNIRTAGTRANGDLSGNLLERASSLFEVTFVPADYLLTHATIVASVDTLTPPGIKQGSAVVDGFRVNRKYSDFRVRGACDKFINNNLDGWSRGVLLKSYPTFIGAHNFVEHVQVEDLSKGRIIDAVARDIGDSVYVDILIATARKHAELVAAINNGKMGTLSMGCTTDGTQCTKCGHWAADETELCPHIKYQKGNTFYDEQGGKHRIAELCGHESLDPHGGVHFIEASWVGTPAFTGAVMRNILEPTPEISRQAAEVLASPPPEWSDQDMAKAASEYIGEPKDNSAYHYRTMRQAPSFHTTLTANSPWATQEPSASDFLAGWEDVEDEGGEDAPAKEDNKGPFDDIEQELRTHLLDRVKKKVKEDMKNRDVQDALNPEDSSAAPNDSVVKEGQVNLYKAALDSLVRTASTSADLINGVASLNEQIGVRIPVGIYRVALLAGDKHLGSTREFLSACRSHLGRTPSPAEARTFVRLGKLLNRHQSGQEFTDTGSSPREGATR